MKKKIALLLSLTLIPLVPQGHPYTKADLQHLQSLTSMGALSVPLIKIAEHHISTPTSNTYQQRHLVTTTKDTLKKLGTACIFGHNILAAATESDEHLISILNACLLAALEAKPNLVSSWDGNDCKETGRNLAYILATNIGNHYSDKIIKKLCHEEGLRLVRRALRVLARSALAGGSKVGIEYLANKIFSENLQEDRVENFFSTAAITVVKEFIYETCGEILAQYMEKESIALE